MSVRKITHKNLKDAAADSCVVNRDCIQELQKTTTRQEKYSRGRPHIRTEEQSNISPHHQKSIHS